MASTRAQRIARQYLETYGLIDIKSMEKLNQLMKSGGIHIKGNYTPQEVYDGLVLANALSYAYNPTQYDAGTGKSSPEEGKTLLESQELRSPTVQQQISNLLPPDHEYSVAVKESMAATEKSEAMQRTSEQLKELSNNGLTLEVSEQEQQVAAQEADAVIHQTASGNGYARVAMNVGKVQEPRPVSGSVSMKQNGKGGTYTSSLGNGDRRTQPGYGETKIMGT